MGPLSENGALWSGAVAMPRACPAQAPTHGFESQMSSLAPLFARLSPLRTLTNGKAARQAMLVAGMLPPK